MAILVDHIMQVDSKWPVLVFMPNVLSAQVLAATLRYRGVEVAAVSGQTGRQERREIIERFGSKLASRSRGTSISTGPTLAPILASSRETSRGLGYPVGLGLVLSTRR